MKRLAAIDIGSNAARLLLTDVVKDHDGSVFLQKINLIRIPLRLGLDVFETGSISKEKIGMMVHTIKAYKSILQAYNIPPQHLITAATSAMRDAKNSAFVIKKILKETDIKIDIISGDLEANLIYENHVAESMEKIFPYLYIDVGGGSTELTLFAGGKLIFKKSFNIGTIRLLKGQVDQNLWDELKEFVKSATKSHKNIQAIGSGGNINKLFSLSKKKEGKALSSDLLKDYYKELSNFSIEDRMRIYKLREDRADVIVPALQIYIQVMKWANIEEIYVPKIGLADGLIHHLYESLTTA